MRIVVLMKEVPDTDDVKMDPESGTMIREGAGGVVNPLDLHAMEAARQLRGEAEDEILLISMGPRRAEQSLREGLALGADRAILATDRLFAGGDSLATARTLAAVIEKVGRPDVIIAGEKATDGETGQVGPEVAALLGLPFATHVASVLPIDNGLRVTCVFSEGVLVQELPLPCLFTALSLMQGEEGLSMPTLAGKKRARSLPVEILCADELRLRPEDVGLKGSPTRVVSIRSPKLTRAGERYSAASEKELKAGLERAAAILKDLALI